MAAWLETDWSRMFVPQMSLPEILLRGTLTYLAVVLLFRIILKRQAGKVAASDLLVTGMCRNPLVRDAYSITDGLLVVVTVLLWSYLLDWLSYYSAFVHRLLHSPPVPLIRDGVVLSENLARELITEGQLQSRLRHEGQNDPARVAEAWLEGNGHVSVVPRRGIRTEQARRETTTPTGRNQEKESGPQRAVCVQATMEQILARCRERMTEQERDAEQFVTLLAEMKEQITRLAASRERA
jgi:uncharacterized membrane protein YcaP (DUF421 family)